MKNLNRSRLLDSSWLLIKRIMDLLIGSLCLTVFGPLILVLFLLVRLESPGSPLFRQVRVGRNGKLFTIYKMRTLYIEYFGIVAGEEEPCAYRITQIGKLLRRSKLDELPQLINVLQGNMSLVGPRPDIPEQVANYTEEKRCRLLTKPGMTGIAQISGNTLLTWTDRIYLDNWYIKHWSWLLDLKIILFTLIPMIKGESLSYDPFDLHKTLRHIHNPF